MKQAQLFQLNLLWMNKIGFLFYILICILSIKFYGLQRADLHTLLSLKQALRSHPFPNINGWNMQICSNLIYFEWI
jgi:hypothetical protein